MKILALDLGKFKTVACVYVDGGAEFTTAKTGRMECTALLRDGLEPAAAGRHLTWDGNQSLTKSCHSTRQSSVNDASTTEGHGRVSSRLGRRLRSVS